MKQSKFGIAGGLRAFAVTLGLVVGASALPIHGAQAADACISDGAKKALEECPAGTIKATAGRKPQVSFKSAPTPVSLKKDGKDNTKPVNPTDQMNAAQRDERRAKMQKKSRQLLVTEIQNTESLFADTKKNAPDRPKLARRLAEGFVELENAAFREMTENDIKAADFNKKKNAKAAGEAKQASATAKKVLEAARKSAIKYYSLLKDQYPKWCQNPNAGDASKSTGCGDEVLYYLAYEHEQGKDYDKARKVYYELIQSWPKSKYIPNAYLAFGELFFQEALVDPGQWSFAEQSYQEVIKYPAPDNKVFGYAHYKLGYVYWNQGEYAKSINAFKQVIEYGTKFASLPNAPQLATSARRDIIPVYALSGDPRKAYTFFKPLSGDDGTGEKTYKMMDELGLNYLDTGHYPEAITLYQDLMGRDKGPRWCLYQGHITEATLAMKSGDKDLLMKELNKQVEVYKDFNAGQYPAPDKLKCANLTASLETETAMAWHLEAVGSNGVRGTSDPKTMKLAAQLYENVVLNFKSEEYAKFTFPRILKEDWPSIMKIKYAMADLLYFQKDWAKCGPAFDSVVAEDPKGPNAAEAAFASVLCYQNIYTEKHKDGSDRKGNDANLPGDKNKDAKVDQAKFARKEFDANQKGMMTAFNRYVCYIKPGENDKDAKNQYADVKFARARLYYESNQWEEAAAAYRDVATNHADHEVGVFAGRMYLESLNVLGTRIEPKRPSCLDDIAKDVPTFIKSYCEGNKKAQNEEQCGIFFATQRDIERLRAQTLVEAADKGSPDAIAQYRTAAGIYMDLWEKYGREACETKKESCKGSEEVLYNAARAYQAARLVAKAIATRRLLIDPKYNLSETALAVRAIYEIGGNYQAIAVYDEAARWYERYAEKITSKDSASIKWKDKADADTAQSQAAQALSDATVLRLGLGQEDQAIKNADAFNRAFGTKKPAESAQINFAIGAHYVDREDWAGARKRLSGAMSQIDRNATADITIQAHAMLGRVYQQLGSKTQARGEYDKVRNTWRNPDEMVKKLNAVGGAGEDETIKLRRLAKTLTAVGEAQFFFAEEKREVAEKIQFPAYKGSGERQDVLNFVNTKVKDWIAKKRPAIADAEKEYLKILDLQPAPPPKWVIAAGSRVGLMKGKFVAEFRAAPIPKDWTQSGPSPYGDLTWEEIRGTYYDSLDQASEPIKQEAKAAYRTCLDLSVKRQYFDENSRACEKWLSKNYASEYHLIDEFRGAPTRMGSGLQDKPLPLNFDGTPYAEALPDAKVPEKPASGGSSGGSKTDSKPADKGATKGGTTAPAKPGDSKGSKEDDALDRATRK